MRPISATMRTDDGRPDQVIPIRGKSLISMQSVDKVFPNGTEALRDVSLEIPSTPQFLSLLGPSGCGKSTMLSLISGLERQSSGNIHWPTSAYDADMHPLAEIGFVFQEPTLMPWATVFENVYLPLRLKGEKRAAVKDRVMEFLRMVGLEKFARSYPRELSGGMKMRVSIARAVVTQPKILLMDEPFAALDEITRLRLNNDLLALCEREHLTVIFVTHSVFKSVYLSDRVVVMAARPGRVIADLAIEGPVPRTEEYRTSPAYAAYCREVSQWLKQAMAGVEDEI